MASQVVRLYLRVRHTKDPGVYSINHKNFSYRNENYVFRSIFSKESSQQEIYEEIGKPLVDNIMQGINGILLAYGSSGAGKTYSLLGDQGQDGLLQRVLEDVFQRARILKPKKAINIVLSSFEIDKERIKDLAKLLPNNKNRFNEETLEIREHLGNAYIDNLTVTQIDSLKDALHIIQEGRRLRKIPDPNFESLSLVHTVFKITVSQKEMNVSKAGTLTIVDLADSESNQSSILKTLDSLRNLIIDLQQGHHASSDESILTKILANNIKHNCLTSVLFHVNTSNDQTCHNTLMFSNNCYSHENDSGTESLVFKSQQQMVRVRKLQDEIKDLKHQIDKTQEIHEGKLRGFGEIIGFNVDIEAVFGNNPGKEKKSIENHVNSVEILDEVQTRNKRLELKLNKNSIIFEELQKFELKNKERNASQIKALEDQIKTVKLEIIELNEKIQENVRKKLNHRTEELHQILISNHLLLEEKAAIIQNLPLTLQSIASDMRAVIDYKELGKSELENELSKKYKQNEENHSKNIKKIKQDIDQALKTLDNKMRVFDTECSIYIREKYERIKRIEKEIIKLYNLYLDQDRLIKNIECGLFNNGIKPIYITIHDIPKPPQREKYPYLFKSLMTNGVLTSSKDNNFIKISNSLFTKKYSRTTKNSFYAVRSSFRITFPPPEKVVEIKPDEGDDEEDEEGKDDIKLEEEEEEEEEKEEISEKSIILREEAEKIQKRTVEIAKKAKEMKYETNSLEVKVRDKEVEIRKMTGERDKHRELYCNIVKSKVENRVVIESQKRLLDKFII
ncbi:hypothetical protein SteCoe_20632 [Stentor coeruleus]|uniref:Kinesin motor domain-containing protein n=1 Tax=Stentor coeruleus TaxID=5963 RepID=A0A1R2BRJ9_9CILI|nr:hypothetical protein SteCoe_20632 [Stentor coeruleus]